MIQNNGVEKGIDVELSDELVQGKYANLAIISHSTTEFIIDFASMLPGMQKAKVSSRVILTPEHAKRLLYSIQENIARYETNHGPIEMHQREMAQAITPVGEA